MGLEVLDNPVLASLTGRHSCLALGRGRVARYPRDVSPFMGIPEDCGPDEWRQLARLAGHDPVVLVNPPSTPSGWSVVNEMIGLQMLAPDEPGRYPDIEWPIVSLGPPDAPDMLALAFATEPGPFAARTGELGSYLGVRDGGQLIAMAGECLQPDGWSEISAVCTDPAYRGRGLARALVARVDAGIKRSGRRSFLHVLGENSGAIGLYRAMGYNVRRDLIIRAYNRPGHAMRPSHPS